MNRLAISADGKVLLAATRDGPLPQRRPGPADVDARARRARSRTSSSIRRDNAKAVAGALDAGEAVLLDRRRPDTGRRRRTPAVVGPRRGRPTPSKNPTTSTRRCRTTHGEIWRSTDGGKTYHAARALADGVPAPYLGDQGWYGNVIWAGDPTDADLVDRRRHRPVAQHRRRRHAAPRSARGGTPRSAHADQHAIVVAPGLRRRPPTAPCSSATTAASSRPPMCARSATTPQPPRVTGWEELNNTYGVTQFYAGAGNAASGTIIGGAQDNGTLVLHPGRRAPRAGRRSSAATAGCARPTRPTRTSSTASTSSSTSTATPTAAPPTTRPATATSAASSGTRPRDVGLEAGPVPDPGRDEPATRCSSPRSCSTRTSRTGCSPAGCRCGGPTTRRRPNTTTSGPRWRAIKPSAGSQHQRDRGRDGRTPT